MNAIAKGNVIHILSCNIEVIREGEPVWRQPPWYQMTWLTKRYFCYFETEAKEYHYEHVKHRKES